MIGALAGLNTQQGPCALNQISGQPYADFGTFNVANNALFMNALGQQMALARGGRGSGQRQALAEACDVAACDGASPFSVWGSVLGGVGSVQGDGNSSTFTYNVGGAAAGIDYRLSPSFLVGIGTGYTNGTQWVDSFQGKGWSNTVSVSAYGSFTQWGLYVDALAGYAYSNNQLQRQISSPACSRARPAARPAPTSSWARSRPATPSASMLRPRPPSRRSRASRRRASTRRHSASGAPTASA